MEIIEAIIIGIIQGLTEFLPVSSSAHLMFAQYAFNIPELCNGNILSLCKYIIF